MANESIFDFELSEGEKRRFNILKPELYEMVKESDARCSDDRYYRLGMLYAMRGDYDKSREYYDRIEDREMLRTLVDDYF